jgi:hypothetical protein
MHSLDEFQALVQADAREVAERSLRHRFGQLSNTRILSVLRPAAAKVDGLRGLSDTELLDRWFSEFSRLRSDMQRTSPIASSGPRYTLSVAADDSRSANL